MDVLNFISWLKAGKYSLTMPTGAVTVVGVPNTTRGDVYLPVTVPVTAFGGSTGSNIGKQIGGGIVVAEWDENGVKKALVASLTDLGPIVPWTDPLLQGGPNVPGGAASPVNGFTNTNNIILQTGASATAAYAAGAARLHTGGSFTDWYLPAIWELNMCYNAAAIVNRVLGATGFAITSNTYWSSTETSSGNASILFFGGGSQSNPTKGSTSLVRAVRIHTL
jgi:hypothetical protein